MSFRRGTHEQYLQELQLMGKVEVVFTEIEERQYPDYKTVKVLYAGLSNNLCLGKFVKSKEGFWRFSAMGSTIFDDIALRKIAGKLVELNLARTGVERIHE